MACYAPLTGYYSKELNPTGKRSLVFNAKYAVDNEPIEVPCGQCVGCRLERSRQWAMRCMHEASLHENNCFITLTFDTEELKKRENEWSLETRDYQLFMKRLRKKFGAGIRFYSCGEYGEQGQRPHYHACLFNFDFPDKKLWKQVQGNNLYTSEILEELWPYGFSTIGDVTFQSAAYVARYIMKKVNGEQAEEHYQWACSDTGTVKPLKPEFTTMSRRPGIGKGWIDKYIDDAYPSDFITVNGKKCRPPKFYDKILEDTRPFEFDNVKEQRKIKAEARSEDLTPARLNTKQKIAELRLRKLARNHDKA